MYYPCSKNKGTDQLHSYSVFVFAYANCWFSHAHAHIKKLLHLTIVFQLCESKPQVTDEMFQGMINKAKEQRQQQLIAQQVPREMTLQYNILCEPTICICENKGADQLRGNCEADQHLCFHYTDSAIPLLLKSEISSF